MLHYPTLLLVQIGITVLTTLLMIAAALSADALHEQRLWAIGNVVACLGFVTGTFTALPDVLHGGLSYGLIGLGLALALRGLRQFCGRDLSWRWIAAITVVAFLLPAYFAVFQPSQTMRLVLGGSFLGAINLVCAMVLWRGLHGKIRRMMWPSVGGFATLGLSLVIRSGILLLVPVAAITDQAMDAYSSVTIFAATLAQVCICFGLIMLVSYRHAEKINRLTLLDGLTGVLNRGGLERMGQRVLRRARQGQRSVCVVMVDADHFKAINDTHGHPAGDQVLMHLANALSGGVRPGDLVVRYGGEEFVLILDGARPDTALQVAERLRETIAQSTVTAEKKQIRYQVSMGISCSEKAGYVLKQLVADADAALYRAKEEGRNRVRLA